MSTLLRPRKIKHGSETPSQDEHGWALLPTKVSFVTARYLRQKRIRRPPDSHDSTLSQVPQEFLKLMVWFRFRRRTLCHSVVFECLDESSAKADAAGYSSIIWLDRFSLSVKQHSDLYLCDFPPAQTLTPGLRLGFNDVRQLSQTPYLNVCWLVVPGLSGQTSCAVWHIQWYIRWLWLFFFCDVLWCFMLFSNVSKL
jgi:hypothetical protein